MAAPSATPTRRSPRAEPLVEPREAARIDGALDERGRAGDAIDHEADPEHAVGRRPTTW